MKFFNGYLKEMSATSMQNPEKINHRKSQSDIKMIEWYGIWSMSDKATGVDN